MIEFQVSWKRLFLVWLVVFVLAFSPTYALAGAARAQGMLYGDAVPAGQVVDNDLILTGTTVTLDGSVTGDVLAVGNNVKISGSVAGSLIVIGETVSLDGEVAGTTYVAALTLELGETASLQRNLYYAGLELTLPAGAQIERDLYALSLLGAQLTGAIGRDVKAVIGPSEFIRLIIDAVGGQVNLSQGAYDLKDMLEASDASSLARAGAGLIQAPVFIWASTPPQVSQAGAIDSARLMEWGQALLQEFTVLLIYGFLGLWLFTPSLARASETLRVKPLPVIGYGLLALIIAINLLGVVLLLAGLLIILGLWLGSVTLWELAFAFWAVGFSSLALATTLLTLFVLYGTKVIVAYLIGKLALRPFMPKVEQYRMLPLLAGLIVYVLIRSVPLLGWVVAIAATALGLGAAVMMYVDQRRAAKAHVNRGDLSY